MPAQDFAPSPANPGRRSLTAQDTLAARRVVFADGRVSRQEAEALIAMNAEADDSAPEWRSMFAEAMTDLMVHQAHPAGWVDEARAQWMIGAFVAEGRAARQTELEAVVHVLEKADQAPQALADFALDHAKATLTAGDAPLSAADVELMRRVVFAPAGAGSIAVTRQEAEALFDINDVVRDRANDPAWADFFARAVGNSLMAAPDRVNESRGEALRQEAWLHARPTGFGLMSDMAKSLFHPADIAAAWREPSGNDLVRDWNAHEEAANVAASSVTAPEAAWVRDRIGRDGRFDPAEHALIRFLGHNGSSVDPSLQDMVAEADKPDAA